ncbi:uncharacterized protein [Watersipora subatra]|uniref:uncharacterized protein isoform X2 n=1 Tax=Watersipora subatra TaxID=2589382 RepID=UPI00355C7A0E
MHWTVLLLLVSATRFSSSALIDQPPTINKLGFLASEPGKNFPFNILQEPQDFVVTGKVSDNPDERSRLMCEASNADNLQWEYRETPNLLWNTTLPMETESNVLSNGGTVITHIISASGSAVTGYYRCIATYLSYKSLSPTIRLVVPYIVPKSSIYSAKVPNNPTQNQPFVLPCFKDIDEQLVPKDAANFTNLLVSWIRREGNVVYAFPDEFDGAVDKGRFSVDPTTGALLYGYVLNTDSLPTLTNDGAGRLQCEAYLDQQTKYIVGNYAEMSILSSTSPLEDVDVSYPPYNMVDGEMVAEHVCTSNKLCRVVTTFTGAFTARGKVVGKVVGDTGAVVIKNGKDRPSKEGGPYSGFEFFALEQTEVVRYVAELTEFETDADGNEVPKTVLASLYIDVTTQNYPSLNSRDEFPVSGLVQTGSSFDLDCSVFHVDAVTFYINGVEVVPGTPSFVLSVGQDKLVVGNIQRSDSFSVQCVAENEAGSLYVNSIINVYDPPSNVTQYPLASDPYRIQEGANISAPFQFNYSVTLDKKTREASIYWKTTRKVEGVDLENSRITSKDKYGIWGVTIREYDPAGDGLIYSQLYLEIDRDTQRILAGTEWHAVVEYYLLDSDELMTIKSEPVKFEVYTEPTSAPIVPPFAYTPVIVGAVAGLIFLILLIIMIRCYVKKNTGEQYYVEEQEKHAGHNPKEEMEAYAFSDYTRPSPDYPTAPPQTHIGYM